MADNNLNQRLKAIDSTSELFNGTFLAKVYVNYLLY